ncbi:hypothetical protein CRUP_019073 [Coryphaenoides rupestris]|nr:hypothetical protein CRUP_019073 [Coryphaenoides rupestris]
MSACSERSVSTVPLTRMRCMRWSHSMMPKPWRKSSCFSDVSSVIALTSRVASTGRSGRGATAPPRLSLLLTPPGRAVGFSSKSLSFSRSQGSRGPIRSTAPSVCLTSTRTSLVPNFQLMEALL